MKKFNLQKGASTQILIGIIVILLIVIGVISTTARKQAEAPETEARTTETAARATSSPAPKPAGSTVTPTKTTAPAVSQGITVLAPKAGDVLTPGSTYTIRWSSAKSVAYNSVSITLIDDRGLCVLCSSSLVVPDSGSYLWNIPSTIQYEGYSSPQPALTDQTNYRLRITPYATSGTKLSPVGYSANFRIGTKETSSALGVTVTSPKGGEVWTLGNASKYVNYPVSFNVNNGVSTTTYGAFIYLVGASGAEYRIGQVNAHADSNSATIPWSTDFNPAGTGQFRVRVKLAPSLLCDSYLNCPPVVWAVDDSNGYVTLRY